MRKIKDEIDKPLCNCGIVGVFNHPQASLISYYALHSLQHRGQEAAGITTFYYDEQKKKMRFATEKGAGLVLDVFSDPKVLTENLKGTAAIAHNRYSTTGSSKKSNIQPFNMIYHSGILSIAHNGNLTNTRCLRKNLHQQGSIFQTTTDTEIFLHLIAHSKKEKKIDQIREALQLAEGAYSLVILTEDSLIAARDAYGFRPLNIGRIKLEDGSYSYIVASETCAFDIVDAEFVRDVKHNEIVIINKNTCKTGEMQSFKIVENTPEARHCIFEYIYFSRPDSKIFGHNVDKVRRKLGKMLAEESPMTLENNEKISTISVPDSANTAALGYARINQNFHQNTVFEIGLIRSHYVGRTFIAPSRDNRIFRVKVKFNPVKGVIEDRNILIIDDSIVRGTTSKALIKLIRSANPKQLHLKITSPQIKYPCFYGMDFPSREELIANDYDSEEKIGEALGVDSLHYLTIEKLIEAVPKDEGVNYCTACFTGEYPVEYDKKQNKFVTEE